MRDATQALTVIAEIDHQQRPELERRLASIARAPETNPLFRPMDLPDTHFMRFVIIDDPELPALLAWESNHDRSKRTYLSEVLAAVPGLARVFECCVGFPGAGAHESRLHWLLAHSVRAGAFYTAYRGVPRAQVTNDRRIHDVLRAELDRPGGRAALTELHEAEIQRRLCDYVRTTHPELDSAVQDNEALRFAIGKVLAVIAGLCLLPFALAILLPWLWILRSKEKQDRADANARPVHDDKGLAASEDVVRQNQLTHIVDIKPGWFRLTMLRIVLFVLDVIARVYAVNGHLGGITSIHFARWVIVLDKRRQRTKRHRLVFFSNYDGSWESYLGEFVDRAAYGLTGVWSNTVGFPNARWLLGGGARDEEAFKQWTRRHQIPTQVWWSGVPDSTVQNVRNDVWIRRNLGRGLPDDEVETWLRAL